MTALVLNFRNQDGFPFERGCPADPVAFRLHADDFAVSMLADLTHQRLAVGIGHPVLRLNFAVGVYDSIKTGLRRQTGIAFQHWRMGS